jgi:hypothetical protein
MKVRKIALALALCLAAAAVCYAADNPNMGTWKLNEAKSKIPPGATKNSTVVYAPAGDQVKVTTDGTMGGKPVQTEWTGMFDGKDYPLTGDPTANTRSYTKINDRTLELTNKKDGKITTTGRITVSPDGKSRTVVVHAASADGKKTTSTAVYDKQQ